MNPFITWSIYIAAQVYVRALHSSNHRTGLPIAHTSQTSPSQSSQSDFNLWTWSGATGRGPGFSPGGISKSSPTPFGGTSTARSSINSSRDQITTTNRTTLLESLECLISALNAFNTINPIAGVFEAQIRHELSGGKELTDERLVGRVDFPLDRQQSCESAATAVADFSRLL